MGPRSLSLVEQELREQVADVEQLRIEELRAISVSLDGDTSRRDGLGVVASEAIGERVWRLRERLHRGARHSVFAREDGVIAVGALLLKVLQEAGFAGERAGLVVLKRHVDREVLR